MVSGFYPLPQWFDPIVSLSPKIAFLFQKGGFGFNEFVLFGKVGLFFNGAVQKGVDQPIQLLLGFSDFLLKILGEKLRRLGLLFFLFVHFSKHFLCPVFAESDFF